MNKLNHVAFIMDGNGRWGKKKRRGRNFGHYAGVKTVKKIVEASIKFKIPIVTFYVFSTENWKRPKSEIKYLFNLISSYFKDELDEVVKNGIKINILGELKNLPESLEKLECANNQLRELDLARTPQLKVLICSNNPILILQHVPPSLDKIEMENNPFVEINNDDEDDLKVTQVIL